MIEQIAVALTMLMGSSIGVMPVVPRDLPWFTGSAKPESNAAPVFRTEDHSVSSWRAGTRATLEPAPLAIAAAFLASGRPIVTRCVKLNNPWCIKQARWNGELGGDDESHTAFATTEHGADAAANLLRTYYVTLGRKTALDIVRRWAPAECRIGDGNGMSVALAIGGLANTLRAKFLASQGGRGTAQPRHGRQAGRSVGTRVSRIPLAPLPEFRVPDIAAGMGERPIRRDITASITPRRSSPPKAVATRRMASAPVAPSCGSEEGRIQYYGQAIAKALVVSPNDDLKLFDAAGQPTENLLPVMVAMSAIELGYLHAGPELVERAIERLRVKLAQAALAQPSQEGVQGIVPPPRPTN